MTNISISLSPGISPNELYTLATAVEPPQRHTLTDSLAFPLELDLQPYTQPLRADGSKLEHAASAAADQEEKWYDLYGVVVHTGGAFGGHYYAYV
eukprot:SAG11_NODE_19461_length_466_cov_0.697548_1_plen_94_part_01